VPLLEGLVLEGRIFTMDALLTQRMVAQVIVEGGGDYVLYAKGNQPRLAAAIRRVFTTSPAADAPPPATASTTDRGHGRVEHRRLTVRAARFAGREAWPGLRQVFQLERETRVLTTGAHRQEVVYGLTSLVPLRADLAASAADATRLLDLTRHQWHIENRSHWVRDVTFDEDRSQVRCGSIPEILAAFRNAAIGLLRLAGERNIAAGCRRMAAQPRRALALLGLARNN
jgi:predicted transposase YbfD/YdcC